MAEQIDVKQQHLDDHYGDLGLKLVDEPDDSPGMTGKEASAFLRGLRPVVRAGQTLAQAARKSVHKKS